MASRMYAETTNDNRYGKIFIVICSFLFVIIMSAQITRVYKRDVECDVQLNSLNEQLRCEEERQSYLQEYEKYVQSEQYIEDIAKSKLGLVYPNEIIFREQ